MTLLGLGLRKTVTPAKAGVQRLLAFPSIIHARKGRPLRLPCFSCLTMVSTLRMLTEFSRNLLCAPSSKTLVKLRLLCKGLFFIVEAVDREEKKPPLPDRPG